jgi:hypothetical protein
LGNTSGNNTAVSLNFIPVMNAEDLINGYRTILSTIYAPRQYYHRVISFLSDYRPQAHGRFRLKSGYIGAFFKSMFFLGIIGRERFHFWKLFFWSLARRPRLFSMAITFAIYGHHFRKVAENISWTGMFAENSYPLKCE